jgi:hypothetical protein
MYSFGGIGVAVGAAVGSSVGAGVLVLVGVRVSVGVAVGVVTRPVVWSTRKIRAAPRPRTSIIKPNAAGKLSFNSGNFGPLIGLAEADFTFDVKDLPQTKQRVAFSLNRVPQVGHTLLLEVFISGVIISSFLLECVEKNYNISEKFIVPCIRLRMCYSFFIWLKLVFIYTSLFAAAGAVTVILTHMQVSNT